MVCITCSSVPLPTTRVRQRERAPERALREGKSGGALVFTRVSA